MNADILFRYYYLILDHLDTKGALFQIGLMFSDFRINCIRRHYYERIHARSVRYPYEPGHKHMTSEEAIETLTGYDFRSLNLIEQTSSLSCAPLIINPA